MKNNPPMTLKTMLFALCALLIVSSQPILAEIAEDVAEQEVESKPYEKDDIYYQLELFSTALTYVLHNFYNHNREFTEEDVEKAISGAIRGMMLGLGDRYSFYQSEERRRREQEDLFHARFGGLEYEYFRQRTGLSK